MISWWTRFTILVCCALAAWFLMGCSMLQDDEARDKAEDELLSLEKVEPVETLYNKALDTFATSDYDEAMKQFEEVEREYPYSPWAKRAQVMAAYSAYRDTNYDEAALMLDRFVKLYPNNERTPYAYYLRALCFYDQIVDVGRDQKTTQMARQALQDLVSRFPDSEYARDARIKLELTEDHLAGKEMQIGRYYQGRDEPLAALNRFKYVIDNYQTTSHIAEALHRMVEVYLKLGVKEEAKKYASVLGHNYPGSQWYEYSYAMMNGDVNPLEAAKGGSWYNVIPGL